MWSFAACSCCCESTKFECSISLAAMIAFFSSIRSSITSIPLDDISSVVRSRCNSLSSALTFNSIEAAAAAALAALATTCSNSAAFAAAASSAASFAVFSSCSNAILASEAAAASASACASFSFNIADSFSAAAATSFASAALAVAVAAAAAAAAPLSPLLAVVAICVLSKSFCVSDKTFACSNFFTCASWPVVCLI